MSSQQAGAASISTPWTVVDAYFILGVALLAFVFARWYLPVYRASGGTPFFYQQEFAPAVTTVCGRGFVNPEPAGVPALQAFLAQRVDSFDCGALPASMPLKPLNAFQAFSRYLMLAAAAVWRVTGINWRALDYLGAAFFGISIGSAYAVLRFVGGRVLSLLFACLWMTSTWHLQNLPHLRDYSKVPFFVLTLAAAAVAVAERRMSRFIVLGLTFGIVQGVGYGMRADVLFNFAPFLVVLAIATLENPLRNVAARVACAAAALVAFVLIAYPIQAAYRDNGSLWHVALLGLTAPYDVNLHLKTPGPPYDFGYMYNDGYIETVVGGYWERFHGVARPIILGAPQYGTACRDYFVSIARTFPGDLVTRMVSASLHVLDIPFSFVYGVVPPGITNTAAVALSEWRAGLMQRFESTGPLIMAVLLTLLGVERLRYTCVAFVLVLLLVAYPALQYQWRHIFHLELLVLAMISGSLALLWKHGRAMASTPGLAVRCVRSAGAVAALFATVGVTLAAARAVQAPQARALLAAYADAPLDALTATPVELPGGRTRVTANVFEPAAPTDGIGLRLLAVDFAFDRCGSRTPETVTFRYDDRNAGLSDFSWTTPVPTPQGSAAPTRVYLPVYSVRRDSTLLSEFSGVEVPAAAASCLRVFRVRDLDRLPPLLLPAILTPDWSMSRLYQRFPAERAVPPPVWYRLLRVWPGLADVG